MEDLSLHILDIAENSLAAGATRIGIAITEDLGRDLLTLEVVDNGRGMDAAEVAKALDPFYTTRTTRRVGLGLPLLAESARAADGTLEVRSAAGAGTTILATFRLRHIDRKPLGNMAETITTLLAAWPEITLSYRHERNGRTVAISTEEIRRLLDGVPVNSAAALRFVREYLAQEEHGLTTNA